MAIIFNRRSVGKPGSVEDDHLSSLIVTYKIKRISACGRVALNADLLATGRVYLRTMSPWYAVSSYLTRFIFA